MSPKPPAPPPAPTPLPASFSKAQASKAVNALIAHSSKVVQERQAGELLSRDEYVYLCVNTKHPATGKRRIKPVRVQLPHPPLPPPPATSVCLITKDPQREYKDLLAAQGIKFVSRVVGVEKLKGKFKPFEARRNLMRDHEVWLADERVVPSLPGLLGKIFLEAKKAPIPVNLKKKDLKTELANAISSTYYHPSLGTSHSVRIATLQHSTPAQSLDNLLAALPTTVAQVPDGWTNVLSVGIKTSGSVFLPVWTSPLEGRFASGAAAADAEGDVEMRADGGGEAEKIEKGSVKGKGKGKAEGKEQIAGSEKVKEKEKVQGKKRTAAAVEDAEAERAAKSPKKAPRAEETTAPTTTITKKRLSGTKESAQVAAKSGSTDKADKLAKKAGKKSSTMGSGGAGKRAKEGVVGRH